MATENTLLMRAARESLKDKWPLAIGTFLVYMLITGSFGAMRQFGVIGLLIAGPLMLGAAMFSLNISRGKEAKLEQLFDGFRFFSKALVTYLLMLLYVILWSLLLIIPGIIAALSYAMSFYILADDPALIPAQVLERSKKMMYGYKWKLFGLCMWFFPAGIVMCTYIGHWFSLANTLCSYYHGQILR